MRRRLLNWLTLLSLLFWILATVAWVESIWRGPVILGYRYDRQTGQFFFKHNVGALFRSGVQVVPGAVITY